MCMSMLTVLCCRYIGRLNRLDAENYLEGMRDGTYLVRQSEAQSDYTHAICIRYESKHIDHVTLYCSAVLLMCNCTCLDLHIVRQNFSCNSVPVSVLLNTIVFRLWERTRTFDLFHIRFAHEVKY